MVKFAQCDHGQTPQVTEKKRNRMMAAEQSAFHTPTTQMSPRQASWCHNQSEGEFTLAFRHAFSMKKKKHNSLHVTQPQSRSCLSPRWGGSAWITTFSRVATKNLRKQGVACKQQQAGGNDLGPGSAPMIWFTLYQHLHHVCEAVCDESAVGAVIFPLLVRCAWSLALLGWTCWTPYARFGGE